MADTTHTAPEKTPTPLTFTPDPDTGRPTGDLRLSPEGYRAVLRWIREAGAERMVARKRDGHRFDESDFLTGAMAVLFALGDTRPINAMIYGGPLVGRSFIDPDGAAAKQLKASRKR